MIVFGNKLCLVGVLRSIKEVKCKEHKILISMTIITEYIGSNTANSSELCDFGSEHELYGYNGY